MQITKKSATFSDDRRYRYSLFRGLGPKWETGRILLVVGLNPSTADENVDDNTIRRVIAFAKEWGMENVVMTNLYAFRSTNPKNLLSEPDPVGVGNDKEILYWSQDRADMTLVAWGANSMVDRRNKEVLKLLKNPFCLGVTKDGHPRHPLYVPSGTQPIPYKLEI